MFACVSSFCVCFFFFFQAEDGIRDWSVTGVQTCALPIYAAQRRRNTFDVALDFLACGLDPRRAVFFRQSDVPEVTELAWLLSSVTPMGLLERATSYKDKLAKIGRASCRERV